MRYVSLLSLNWWHCAVSMWARGTSTARSRAWSHSHRGSTATRTLLTLSLLGTQLDLAHVMLILTNHLVCSLQELDMSAESLLLREMVSRSAPWSEAIAQTLNAKPELVEYYLVHYSHWLNITVALTLVTGDDEAVGRCVVDCVCQQEAREQDIWSAIYHHHDRHHGCHGTRNIVVLVLIQCITHQLGQQRRRSREIQVLRHDILFRQRALQRAPDQCAAQESRLPRHCCQDLFCRGRCSDLDWRARVRYINMIISSY